MAQSEDDYRWSLTWLVKSGTNRPAHNASGPELDLHALIDELIDDGEYDDVLDASRAEEWPSRLLAFQHRICEEAIARWNFDASAVTLLTHELLWSRYRFEPGARGPGFEAYVAFRKAVARAKERSGLWQWGGEHNQIAYFAADEEISPVVSLEFQIVVARNVLVLFVLDDGDRCLVAPTDTNSLAYIDTRLDGMLTPELEQDTLAISVSYRDYWRAWVASRRNHERNFSEQLPIELLPN